MRLIFFCLLFFTPLTIISQGIIRGIVIDKNSGNPLPFATIKTKDSYALTSVDGEFAIRCPLPANLVTSYLGYQTTSTLIESETSSIIKILLAPDEENLEAIKIDVSDPKNVASKIIKETILQKKQNDPKYCLESFSYKSYNKLKITEDNNTQIRTPDTTNFDIEHIFNDAHSFLSEKISLHQYKKGSSEKETVLASRMTGFKQPIYNVLGIKIQSNSLYNENYTIFDNQYISPLSQRALKNYYYKILDTTEDKNPAFVILFQPRKSKKFARLEGVLYIDMKTLAVQKAIIELRGELNVIATHNFQYMPEAECWFPKNKEIVIRPGIGRQKVSLFGGQISVGQLQNKNYSGTQDLLTSKTDILDVTINTPEIIRQNQATIEVAPAANEQPESFWKKYRTSAITEKDLNSFQIIDSIVKAQKIERKIDVIQSFNTGYYPLGFFNFDLTYPLKFNNYEGVRIGVGGMSNKKLSKNIRFGGYLAYGFNDNKFKYGLETGIHLSKKSDSWLNFNFAEDVKEVGSFFYLTDRRVYSLFEPRLVNIDFYYKYKEWSSSLQYQVTPNLISETKISNQTIRQTTGYQYNYRGTPLSTYTAAESTLALRWSPFSKYLKTPDGYKEIYDGYPKITGQYTQSYKGVLNSNFSYSKIGLKAIYVLQRINQSKTSILLEADWAIGDVPLTHLFHAYPNAPTKETVLQRFSVAGRRTFETMYFGEFFSDRLATLQITHTIQPIKIAHWLNPELVFISRYAIGGVDNIENHQGITFSSLHKGYQEAGLEINKLFAGFGLSFAYRYGAYHLPKFDDNIAFKFTFYLKL